MAPKKAPVTKKAPVKKAAPSKGTTKAASTSKAPEKKAEAAAPPELDTKRVIKTIPAKQVAKVLIEDDTEEIRQCKRAVLVIDNDAHLASRFLPYGGANVLEAADPSHMDPERIRKALIGAVRFNKPLTIDLADCSQDMVKVLESRFDEIQPGLFQKCLNRNICKKEVFDSLVKTEDGEEYTKMPDYGDDFEEFVCKKFMFHILMKNGEYDEEFKKPYSIVNIE